MAAQAAEVSLRRRLCLTGIDEVLLTGLSVEGEVTHAAFAVGPSGYAVSVRTHPTDAVERLTCRAVHPEPVPRHEVIGMVEQ
jgi:hypothetical protein